MTYNPDFKQQEIARHAFMLKLHLAGKGYPSPREKGTPFFHEAHTPSRPPVRVTDNRAHWHLRRMDHDSARTPTREANKTLAASHERISLILQNILIWGAVAWAVWFLFL
jgi:hypothetical protein